MVSVTSSFSLPMLINAPGVSRATTESRQNEQNNDEGQGIGIFECLGKLNDCGNDCAQGDQLVHIEYVCECVMGFYPNWNNL